MNILYIKKKLFICENIFVEYDGQLCVLLPFEPQWLLYIQPRLTFKKIYVLPTQYIYVFLWL
jgi:hypothetical protein